MFFRLYLLSWIICRNISFLKARAEWFYAYLASSSSTGQGSGVCPGNAWRNGKWNERVGLATDHDAVFLFHLLKFLMLYPYLCVAADHDAASRERPMLRPNVGHLAHLQANLQEQKILINSKYWIRRLPNTFGQWWDVDCDLLEGTYLLCHLSSHALLQRFTRVHEASYAWVHS